MSFYERLNDLESANDSLKSKLVHEQLKCSNYSYIHLKKQIRMVLNEYQKHKSILKAASETGVDLKLVIKWFIEGQKGNPHFRNFYLAIMKNRGFDFDWESCGPLEVKDYNIESVGNSWIYATDVGGERISIVSSDYERLKERVRERGLPF